MKRTRQEHPPDGHPLPTEYRLNGWIWSPDTGDYVEASADPPGALAALPPATTDFPQEMTDGPI